MIDPRLCECPSCHGQKTFLAVFPVYVDGTPVGDRNQPAEVPCALCNALGEVDEGTRKRFAQGRRLKDLRVQLRLGMRQAAEQLKMLPSVVCDIEHGRCSDQELALYSDHLARLSCVGTTSPLDSGWIPCQTALPQPNVCVVLYCPESRNRYQIGCRGNSDQWPWAVLAGTYLIEKEVTHWCPLPETPPSEL